MGSRQRREHREHAPRHALRVELHCREDIHRVALTPKGRFRLLDHDRKGEEVIEALGAEKASCMHLLAEWQDACLGDDHVLFAPKVNTQASLPEPLRLAAMLAAHRHKTRQENPPFEPQPLRERLLTKTAETAQVIYKACNYQVSAPETIKVYVAGCNHPSRYCPPDPRRCEMMAVCPLFNRQYRRSRAREATVTRNAWTTASPNSEQKPYQQITEIHVEPISYLTCVGKTGGIATVTPTGHALMLLRLDRKLKRKYCRRGIMHGEELVCVAVRPDGPIAVKTLMAIIMPDLTARAAGKNRWVIRKWLQRR